MKARLQVLTSLGLLLVWAPSARAQDGRIAWERLPGPYGGWARAVASAPVPDGFVAVASDGLSLYRTTDGGEWWDRLEHGPPGIGSLLFTPAGSLWALGAPWISQTPYRSTDHGLTWTEIGDGLPQAGVAEAVALSDGTLYGATSDGLFRLAPGADTWKTTDITAPVLSLGASLDGVVLVGTEEYGRDGTFLYRSGDGGNTWNVVNLPLGGCGNVYELAALPDGVALAVAYCSLVSSGAGGGSDPLFRSTDGGFTWAAVDDPAVENVSEFYVGPGAVYADSGTSPSLLSTDGGLTWTPLNLRVYGAARGLEDEALLATPFYGIVRSSDGGRTWVEATEGFGRAQLGNVAVGTAGRVFAAAPEDSYAGTGLYRSFDRGQTWDRTPLPFVPLGVYELHLVGDALFVAPERRISLPNVGGGLFRSEDEGDTWEDVTPAFWDVNGTPLAVTHLEEDETGALWAVVGAGWVGNRDVYRSPDGGRTWEHQAALPGSVRSFTVAPDGSLWAGVGSNVYRSTDGATSWQLVFDAPVTRVNAIAVTATGTVVATGLSGHYRSVDGGATWTEVDLSTGEAHHEVDVFVQTADGVLFAGVDGDPAVVRSTDDGATWEPVAEGVPAASSHYWVDLALDDQGHLWSALGSKGLFRTVQAVTVRSEPGSLDQPSDLVLSVSPNPFRGDASVSLSAGRTHRDLTIAMFDVTGRRVVELHEGPLGPGTYEFDLSPASLAAGVYVIRAIDAERIVSIHAIHIR